MGTYKNVNATVRYLLDFEAVPYNQKMLGHPMVLKDLEKRHLVSRPSAQVWSG